MTFRTFFLTIFVISISLCILFTFLEDKMQLFSYWVDDSYHLNTTFLGLVSLITAIFSYTGLIFAYIYDKKCEKAKKIKQEAERINLEKIHRELKAMA
jgi:predicted membrane protein